MSDFKEVKTIAEQMLELSIELLRVVDMSELERQHFIESVKKIL